MKYSRTAITQLTRWYRQVLIKCAMLNAAVLGGLGLSAIMNTADAEDLWDAINNATESRVWYQDIYYELPSDKSSLGELKVKNFVLEGNDHIINLDNKRGLVIGSDKTMTINKVIIKNAKSLGDIIKPLKAAEGAAILNKGTLTIADSEFTDNSVVWNDAGAIYNRGKIISLDANFNSNKTTDSGGAIYNNNIIDSITAYFNHNMANDYGGAIYNNGTIGSISKAYFYQNYSYNDDGGAIYNNGTINSISGDFNNNSTVQGLGGAIYNNSTIGTISGHFKDNHTNIPGSKEYYGAGGAIYNNGTIDSIKGTFENNQIGVMKDNLTGGGGAISNESTINSISANFIGNVAKANRGGAIYNNGTIDSISGTFENNLSDQNGGAVYNAYKISSITGDFKYNVSRSFGGAIANKNIANSSWKKNNLFIYNFVRPAIESVSGNFTGNTASIGGGAIYVGTGTFDYTSGIGKITGNFTNNSAGSGGAIYAESARNMTVIGNFEGNSASGSGGAIYFDGGNGFHYSSALTVTGNFINNYTTEGKGGAIYVKDNTLIVATDDTHDITFSGNKQNVTTLRRDDYKNILEVAGGESNAIFNDDYVEFDAKAGRTIWMYDRLADENNAGWEWVKKGSGTLALGEDMSGIKGDIDVEGGTIKLVQNDRAPSIYGTGFNNASEVYWEDNTRIDSQNDHIENVSLGVYTKLNGTLHALIDVNLSNQTADKLVSGGAIGGSGNVVINGINIVTGGGTFTSPRSVLIADEYTKGKIWLSVGNNITGEGITSWTIGYNPRIGILDFWGDITLKEVTNAISPAQRIFNAAKDELVAENIGNIGHDSADLTINMNNYKIDGQNHSGIVTTIDTQKLTVNDATVTNFLTGSNGAFIIDNNGVEININNSEIVNNNAGRGGAIYNSGNLIATDTNFKTNTATGLGGAIYSTGDVSINAANKAVSLKGNMRASTPNDIYMSGTESRPATLALNSKDDTHTITIGSGIEGRNFKTTVNDSAGSVGKVIFDAVVTTDTLEVKAGTLENNAWLITKGGSNNGTISGTSSSPLGSAFILDGNTETSVFDNNGSFTQKALSIQKGEFRTNADNLHLTESVLNSGVLTLTGGNLDTVISGSGNTQIKGNVRNDSGKTISQNSVTIENTASFTTAADKVTTMYGISNAGNLNLTGGNLASAINWNGTTNIKGDVTNTSGKTIWQKSVIIENTASLTVAAYEVEATDGISNAGNLNLTGGNLASVIRGIGNTQIKGNVRNDSGKMIAQNSVIIDSSASFTTAADKVTTINGIANAGAFNITGGDLVSDVTGAGTTNIKGEVTNNSGKAILQKSVVIEAGKGLTTAADKVVASDGISNAGNLDLTGGNFASSVSGAGTTNIKGDVGFANISAAISQAVNIETTGKLTAATVNLTGDAITNDGTLVFNNVTNGLIGQNISGSTATSGGIVEIAAADGVTINLNGKTITDNDVKLTSGIFDVTSKADTDGNIDISSMKFISGDGILSFQDSKTGNNGLPSVKLGDIDTTNGKNLNIAIDLKPDATIGTVGYADIISANSITGGGKISVSNIMFTYDPAEAGITAMVASGNVAKNNMDFSKTTISLADPSLTPKKTLFSYDNSLGLLSGIADHVSLQGAIEEETSIKLYSMAENENIDNALMKGNSLSVSTCGYNITSNSNDNSTDGIIIADSEQIISLLGTVDSNGDPETTISGFKTAIDNVGIVNLTNTKFSGNTTDIINKGYLNLGSKNFISTITNDTGETNVIAGTSKIGSIVQKDVEIFEGAKLETESITALNGVKNAGDLKITGISNTSNITGAGTTEFANDITNTGNITQSNIEVASGKTLTTTGNITTDTLTNGGTVTLNSADTTLTIKGGTAETPITVAGTISGTGLTKFEGNAQNNGTIVSAVEIATGGKLTTSASNVTGVITNNVADGLTLTGGDIKNSISGDGSTLISGAVTNTTGSAIDNTITVASSGSLTTAANLLGGAVTNNNIVQLDGGTLGQTITGGNIAVIDDVLTAADYLGGVTTVADTKQLTLTSGNLNNNISGTGSTKVTGTVNNKANILTATEVDGGSLDNTDGQLADVTVTSGSLKSNADKLGAVANNGSYEITGGALRDVITGTGVANISGDVLTNSKNITQTDVNIGQNNSGTATTGKLTNNDTITATNVNIMASGTLDNNGDIVATTIVTTGTANFSGGNVDAENITNNGGTTNFAGATVGVNATSNITNNGGNTNITDGIIGAETIDNKAGNISISDGYVIATKIKNTSATVGDDIVITNGLVIADTIENLSTGTIAINGGDVGAFTSVKNSGTGSIDISSIVYTPLVAADSGIVNVNATNGQAATSDLLKDFEGTGAANVTTSSNGVLSVTTNSSAMLVDNNVSGTGTLTLNGNSGASKSNSLVGTEFYISPNVVVSSAINLAAGQLNTGNASNITGPIYVAADATLNAMNGGYSTFNNTTFADGSQLKADISAMTSKSDNFISATEGGDEYLTDLNIQDMHKIAQNSKTINLSQTIGLNNLQSTDDLVSNLDAKYSNVMTPIRKMNANVQQTSDGLMLNFVGTGNQYKDFNPAVMVAPVAAQMGGYLTQLQSYEQAFNNLDTSMLFEPTNLEGISSGDETISTQKKGNVWIKPYGGHEKVGLKNGPKVSNDTYGVFAGQDSSVAHIGNGWNGIFRGYVGYNGSRQKYDGVRINQRGGTLGVSGMVYKDNFFTGLTFNVGASKAKAKTMYGSEDFTMYMGGIASKTGYNLEFADGKFIVQPNMSMSYSIVDTSHYTNAAGVKVDGDPLYALHLQPELKFIGNLENGWQPYASVAKAWNCMDDTKFKANNVALPELSVKSYTKYSVGIQKMWGEKYTGYIKTDLMNGGRDGIGIQAGFTWKFGKL